MEEKEYWYLPLPNAQAAEEISKRLKFLTSPYDKMEGLLFGWRTHPDEKVPFVLVTIEPMLVLPVYIKANHQQVLDEIGQMLGDEEGNTEMSLIASRFRGLKTIFLRDIIPSSVIEHKLTKEQADAMGFFPAPPDIAEIGG